MRIWRARRGSLEGVRVLLWGRVGLDAEGESWGQIRINKEEKPNLIHSFHVNS